MSETLLPSRTAALAARTGREGVPCHGLAGRWQAVRGDGQVGMQRADDDDDPRAALFDAFYVPTLLLVPMSPGRRRRNNDPVRTVVVPGAGHSLLSDQPTRYLRAVDAFPGLRT